MPDNFIDLNSHRADPHLSGDARCLGCGQKWVAVAPVGTIILDCPSCGLGKGVFENLVDPPCDRWMCACGNQHFFVTREGLVCAHCGKQQEFPNFV